MRRRVIEPMMTHRKPKTRHQKPAVSKAGDKFTGCSEGCVSGVRCKVGVISFSGSFQELWEPVVRMLREKYKSPKW